MGVKNEFLLLSVGALIIFMLIGILVLFISGSRDKLLVIIAILNIVILTGIIVSLQEYRPLGSGGGGGGTASTSESGSVTGDGEYVATRKYEIYDSVYPNRQDLNHVSITSDGSLISVVDSNDIVYLVSSSDSYTSRTFLPQDSITITDMKMSRLDGSIIAYVHDVNGIKLFKRTGSSYVQAFIIPRTSQATRPILIGISDDGSVLVVAYADMKIRKFQLNFTTNTYTQIGSVFDHDSTIKSLCINSDASLIFLGDSAGKITSLILRPDDTYEISNSKDTRGTINTVVTSSSGTILAVTFDSPRSVKMYEYDDADGFTGEILLNISAIPSLRGYTPIITPTHIACNGDASILVINDRGVLTIMRLIS